MIVGNGQFLLGDAISIMQQLPADCIDCIVTDPPYRTISGGTNSTHTQGWKGSVLSANDGKVFKHNDVSVMSFMQEFARILKPGSHCYVMTNVLNLREMLNAADAVGLQLHNLLIWQKNTGTTNRWYMKFAEYTLFLRKGPARTINNPGSSNIYAANNPRNKRHPTEKPVDLMEHYVLNSTAPGDLVLEPFAGSGSTLVAAQQNGRRWIGIESDPTYYYPALARVMNL